ncbi:MAG: BrxE family protein [Verrucomicrobiae bacterium]|nr:BrxE family protein [Verrucomicrobiae bacterium]NNJ42133.1 BrxE family protein [Akkermansiaceae bacterium]
MPLKSTPTASATLASLRLSVLASGESLPSKYWDSSGLNQTAQTDLRMIFPRTSITAAATHAEKLAQTHHDKHTRASGVFHLFRLPTNIEASIHREMIHSIPNDLDVQANLWSELADLPKADTSAEEGPVHLGELNLSKPKDIAKIAYAYKAAFDAGLNCIPYFTISE